MPGPPTAGKLPESLYEAPRVAWYANAQDHPSLFLNQERGFAKPAAVAVAPHSGDSSAAAVNQPAASPASQGHVTVTLAGLYDLPAVTLPEPGQYRVSAFYQCEADAAATVDARKTPPVEAEPRPSRKREDCMLGKKIRIPFSRVEQFVKVAVFRVSLPVDVLVGEATLMIADPDVVQESEYGLMLNFEEQGVVALSVQLPGEDAADEEPPFETQLEEQPSSLPPPPFCGAGPPPPFSCSTDPGSPPRAEAAEPASPKMIELESAVAQSPMALCESPDKATSDQRFALGSQVEYFSETEGIWLPATVVHISGTIVTLEYAGRKRQLDSSNKEELDRRVRQPREDPLRVSGDSFFLGLASAASDAAPEPGACPEAPVQDLPVRPGQQAPCSPLAERSENAGGGRDEEDSSSSCGSSSCSSSSSSGEASPEKALKPQVIVAPPVFVGYKQVSGGLTSSVSTATPGSQQPLLPMVGGKVTGPGRSSSSISSYTMMPGATPTAYGGATPAAYATPSAYAAATPTAYAATPTAFAAATSGALAGAAPQVYAAAAPSPYAAATPTAYATPAAPSPCVAATPTAYATAPSSYVLRTPCSVLPSQTMQAVQAQGGIVGLSAAPGRQPAAQFAQPRVLHSYAATPQTAPGHAAFPQHPQARGY